ncbi:hypothetical protein EJ08DRAFT_703605 [Tothia fuscella]|uniref:Uncharacterized protein n=1 Tax=Tothia fuscella TaxID=1048955 RepID=A0A9P4NEB6_9PEZI|nr:hypothetical protein EJ08DRAFT_703605 [Tothia fuscella]
MIEPLSVYGAVLTSLHLLGKFIEVCQRYGDLPKDLDAAYCRLKGCEAALKHWKDKFRLQPGRPPDFYRVLWGDNEADIAHILNQMQINCEKARGLDAELDDFVEKLTALRRISVEAFRTLHNVNINKVRDTSTVIGRGLYYRKTRSSTIKLHHALTYQPDTIRSYLALGTVVDEQRHQSSNPSPRGSRRDSDAGSNRDQDRRQLGVYGLPRLSRAASVGSDSQGLTVCRSSRSPGIKFREYIQDVNKDQHFQFLLQYSGFSYPVVLRPVRFQGTESAKDQIRFSSSFIGVIAELEREELCNLTTTDDEPKRFRVQKYDGPVLKDLHKIANAYGNYLEGVNLGVTRMNTRKWAVGTTAISTDSSMAEALKAMERQFQVAGVNHVVHGQIFRLGVILAELGLGTTLRRVYVGGDRIKLELGSGYKTTVFVASEIETKTSQSYSMVMGFCLGVYERRALLRKRALDF